MCINLKTIKYIYEEFSNTNDYKDLIKCHRYTNNKDKVNEEEVKVIVEFINVLELLDLDYDTFAGFVYSFIIPRIGKEFDLLKITENYTLNIELKSKDNGAIEEQLSQNKFYLSSIRKKLYQFSFDAENQLLYEYRNDKLEQVEKQRIKSVLEICNEKINCNIKQYFSPKNYLVSPYNDSEKLLKNQYFLNQEQMNIRKEILEWFDNRNASYYMFEGEPGSGKTLLLYDIAFTLGRKSKKILFIHCGNLNEGHHNLKELTNQPTIIRVKDLISYNLSNYDLIIVDESQRVWTQQFKELKNSKSRIIFSIDSKQTLSRGEREDDNYSRILSLNPEQNALSGSIRINDKLTKYIDFMYGISKNAHNHSISFDNEIEIIPTDNYETSIELIQSYIDKGYQFINFSRFKYFRKIFYHFDNYNDTHGVIGQEFDKVVVFVNNDFYYKNNKLVSKAYKYHEEFELDKMLYQALTRARDKITIIVINNKPVYKKLLKIKNRL